MSQDKVYHTKAATEAGIAIDLFESQGNEPRDWEFRDGQYNIQIGRAWLSVSDDALIIEAVPRGPALYWQTRAGIIGFRPGADE